MLVRLEKVARRGGNPIPPIVSTENRVLMGERHAIRSSCTAAHAREVWANREWRDPATRLWLLPSGVRA